MTNSTYEQTAAGQGGMGGGRLTVQPCMSPHSLPPPRLSFFLSFFLSFSLFLVAAEPNEIITWHNFYHQLAHFQHGWVKWKKKKQQQKKPSDTGIRAALLSLSWLPTEGKVAAGERWLLNVNVTFQRAARL